MCRGRLILAESGHLCWTLADRSRHFSRGLEIAVRAESLGRARTRPFSRKPMMKFLPALIAALVLLTANEVSAHRHSSPHPAGPGLSNATVLLIRHAEDADRGPGLSPAGETRASAYARYFHPFRFGEQVLRIDTLIAAADSRASDRSRLTLEPLSRASGIPIQQPVGNRHVGALVRWLGQGAPDRTILIAWHHGDLPKLIAEFGADPTMVLGRLRWPSDEYSWVVVLHFDRNGIVTAQSSHLVLEPTPLR